MAPLITIIRTYWFGVTLLLLAVITLLSLTPLPGIPSVAGSDKVHHFIAYGAVSFPIFLRKKGHWLFVFLFFACWSGIIELLQPYVNRHGEWLDMLANTAGISCGLLLSLFINKVFPVALKR